MPSRAQKYAVAQPTIPPPTTITEAVIGRGGRGGVGAWLDDGMRVPPPIGSWGSGWFVADGPLASVPVGNGFRTSGAVRGSRPGI